MGASGPATGMRWWWIRGAWCSPSAATGPASPSPSSTSSSRTRSGATSPASGTAASATAPVAGREVTPRRQRWQTASMTTGRRVRVSSGDAGEVRDAIVALQPRADEMVAVLVAERGAPDLEALVARLNEAGVTFFGGLFPHILEGARSYDRGVLAFTLPRLGEPILIRGLDTDHFEVPDCASLLSGHRGRGKPT